MGEGTGRSFVLPVLQGVRCGTQLEGVFNLGCGRFCTTKNVTSDEPRALPSKTIEVHLSDLRQ